MSLCQDHSGRQLKDCQKHLPRPTLPVFLSIQLRSNTRCRKRPTAHRISSFKYVTGGGSSHEPRATHRPPYHRVANWSTEWGSIKPNFLPAHIFCQQVLFFTTYDSWPLTWGVLAYSEFRGHEAERWTRSGWAQVRVAPSRSRKMFMIVLPVWSLMLGYVTHYVLKALSFKYYWTLFKVVL